MIFELIVSESEAQYTLDGKEIKVIVRGDKDMAKECVSVIESWAGDQKYHVR